MSGIIGHTMYGILGLKAAAERKLPVVLPASRHLDAYLSGAYLGSDIQTMPEAVCLDTDREFGYGTVPVEKSPFTGGAIRPWTMTVAGQHYRPRDIHELFYGRSHLAFGWSRTLREHAVPWDHLPDFFADVTEDTFDLFGPGQRPLAYVLGWIVHVVSDSLIKSVQPGIELDLLDGKYTPRNRPVQDLVTFHAIGQKELGLDWSALFADMAAAPVEEVQFHYMRVAPPRGQLSQAFSNAWAPEQSDLLRAALIENRRWCRQHSLDVLGEMELEQDEHGEWECRKALSERSGLRYAEMLKAAEKAHFRRALWQMGETIADMFAAVIRRSPRLAKLPADDGPSWEVISREWRK